MNNIQSHTTNNIQEYSLVAEKDNPSERSFSKKAAEEKIHSSALCAIQQNNLTKDSTNPFTSSSSSSFSSSSVTCNSSSSSSSSLIDDAASLIVANNTKPTYLQKKLQSEAEIEIEKLPRETINGHTYYVYGNSTFEKAKIRCFAEIHYDPRLDVKKWELLQKYATKNDALLLEYYTHETSITPRIIEMLDHTKNPQIKDTMLNVVKLVPTSGWEPTRNQEWLNMRVNFEKMNYLRDALAFVDNDIVTLIDVFDTPKEDQLSRSQNKSLQIIKKILDSETLSELMDIQTTANTDLQKIKILKMQQKIVDILKKEINFLQILDSEYLKRDLLSRNIQLANEMRTTRADKLYVIAGANHLPTPFSLTSARAIKSLNCIQEVLKSKEYCVLIPEEVVIHNKKHQEFLEQILAQKETKSLQPSPLLILKALGTEHPIYNEDDLKLLYKKINARNKVKYNCLLGRINETHDHKELSFYESLEKLHRITHINEATQQQLDDLEKAYLDCTNQVLNVLKNNKTQFSDLHKSVEAIVEKFIQTIPYSLIFKNGSNTDRLTSFFISDAFLETNSLRSALRNAEYSIDKETPSEEILDSFNEAIKTTDEHLLLANEMIVWIYNKQSEQLTLLEENNK